MEGGFTLDDFTYDAAAGTLTCPNQVTRRLRDALGDLRRRLPRLPAARRCTTAARGRTIHVADGLRAPTVRAKTRVPAGLPPHRPLVERSIAWLTRGNRRVPYRGVIKNNAWLHHRVAGLNLRRLLALGLHLDQGTWALAAG